MKDRTRLAWLAAVAALVYGNTLWNGFTRDDNLYVVANPQVTHPSLWAFFAPHTVSTVFRPLTFASYAVNWALAGDRPFGYHLVNLLLHAGVVCLLYLFLRSILEVRVPEGRTVAFVAALLFAVHPIHTEAVAYVSGRPELLAAGFLLAGCLLHFENRPIAALASFALALLSKESAVVFLPLLLVCDYVRGEWKSARRYAEMAGLTLLYLGVLWEAQGGRFGPPAVAKLDNPLAGLPAHWRILNAAGVAWKYVWLQIYPRVLSCDYSFDQIAVYLDWRHTLPEAVAALALIAGWAWALRKRRAIPALAGGLYFAGFATTANILIPIGTIMGERLAYFPSAGFCLLVAGGWVWLAKNAHGQFERRESSAESVAGYFREAESHSGPALQSRMPANPHSKVLAFALLALVVASLGVRSMLRNLDWRNDFTLALSGVEAAPRSAKMHAYLGQEYWDLQQYDLAARQFQLALEINPDYPDALEAYGLAQMRFGRYPAAGWLLEKAFYTSDRTNLNYDSMAVNLAMVYMKTNHPDGALALLNREIAESPRYGRAWSTRALLDYQLGEKSAAGADAEAALRLDGDNRQAQDIVRQLNTPGSSKSPK